MSTISLSKQQMQWFPHQALHNFNYVLTIKIAVIISSQINIIVWQKNEFQRNIPESRQPTYQAFEITRETTGPAQLGNLQAFQQSCYTDQES